MANDRQPLVMANDRQPLVMANDRQPLVMARPLLKVGDHPREISLNLG